ncbi:hypothetical protein D6D62_00605 [Moraxella catarrhalis]|nr:hypothetical protein D6D62_00605 [Moraxella catarrhalis]
MHSWFYFPNITIKTAIITNFAVKFSKFIKTFLANGYGSQIDDMTNTAIFIRDKKKRIKKENKNAPNLGAF